MGNGWETPGREEVITGKFTGKKTLLYQLVLGGDHLQVQQHADENKIVLGPVGGSKIVHN